MMITGSPGRRCLTFASRSMPENPGMRMSLTSTCGASSSSAASISRALAKLRTWSCSRASAFSSTKRIEWSSSTIQMGFMRQVSRRAASGQWDQYPEIGSSRNAVEFDRAVMLLHEGQRQRQPEPRTTLPPRHQRLEDAVPEGLGHARSVVLDMQFQCQAPALLADRQLARDAGAQEQVGAAGGDLVGERLDRVAHDVEHGLDQLLAVAPE